MELTLAIWLGIALLSFWLPFARFTAPVISVAAALFGLSAGLLSPFALFILIALFLMSFFYFKGKRVLFLGVALALLCWVLSKNWLPGFHNWLAYPRAKLSQESIPFNLFFNYDKAFMGISLLLFLGPLQLKSALVSLKNNWFIAVGCILVLLGTSLALSYVTLDIKLPFLAPVWIVNNLLFVCMPEEALFRGFIQKELNERPVAALAASSLLFGVYHANWGALMVLFGTIAGFFYGWVYMRTEKLEASIATHFIVNAFHFFLLTYPRAYT